MENLVQIPDQLSKILRARRKSMGLTQREAAGLVGLMTKTVSALENRPQGSSIESFFKYLSALNLEVMVQPKEDSLENEKRAEW